VSSRSDQLAIDLKDAKLGLAPQAHDTNDLVQVTKAEEGDLGAEPEFAGNNYWRPPTSEEDLDELLRAEGMLE